MDIDFRTLAPASLPADHPCAGCPARLQTFCRMLGADELARFRCTGSTCRLDAGQTLFHQGDPPDHVFNVTSGTVKLSQLLPDGRRQVVGFLFPGDFFGTADEGEYHYSAEAVEPAEVCRFPRRRFEAFVRDHPNMEQALLRLTARDLALAREQIVLLGRKTAEERLASFLLMLRERVPDQTTGGDTVRLAMSRIEVADFLGLTKETVSRLFTAFKTGGAIRLLSPNLVRITDLRRLGDVARGFARA